MLADFIAGNREKIVTRYRSKAAIASLPIPFGAGGEYAVLVFIEDVLAALRNSHDRTTLPYGDDALEGRQISPRVIQYRDICECIIELAMEMNAPINVADFANLDRCFDDAAARVVTESVSDRGETAQRALIDGSKELRVFQRDVRKLVNTAILALDVFRTGTVGLDGSTGCLLYSSLIELRSLADRIDRDTY
jgi:hypothetical protein